MISADLSILFSSILPHTNLLVLILPLTLISLFTCLFLSSQKHAVNLNQCTEGKVSRILLTGTESSQSTCLSMSLLYSLCSIQTYCAAKQDRSASNTDEALDAHLPNLASFIQPNRFRFGLVSHCF